MADKPAEIVGNLETDYQVTDRGGIQTNAGNTVSYGAMPNSVSPASVNIKSMGNVRGRDLRVKILVPPSYIQPATAGGNNELANLGGIVFPYTPQITVESKADYTSIAPIHTNYAQYFYTRSSVSPISISGKFTVQNDNDAAVYLSTMHLLKSLTKMRFGSDPDAGSPPPVCRLYAYGKYMFDNIPIVISSFRSEFPESVDYYTFGRVTDDPIFEAAVVPTVSTFTVNCIPVYSRGEMQKFNVKDFLENFRNDAVRSRGYV